MKALVVSRLLLGDIPDWQTFESERETAGNILNRRAAPSVSSQIGRNYRDLSIDPEHHFLRGIETSLPELLDTRARMEPLIRRSANTRHDPDLAGKLVAHEKFLSRSLVSASFSLIEAFLSGIFFTAVHTNLLGSLECDEEFLKYAATKESAPLKNRIDRVVHFTSKSTTNGSDEPFKTLIEVGKRYRDAIHHTTPFQRKDVEPGGRLTALYEINYDIALRCVVLSFAAVLKISQWMYEASDATDIARRCSELIQKAIAAQSNKATERTVASA